MMPEDTAPEEEGTQTPQTPPPPDEPVSPFGFQSYPSSQKEESLPPPLPPSPEPPPPLAPQPPPPPPPPLQPSVNLPVSESSAQAQVGQPPPQETGEKGNFLSRLKRVLLILAVLIILAVGGVFGYQTLVKKQSDSQISGGEESTPSPQAPAVGTPSPGGSSSFSSGIYQNSQSGFTIEPPIGWQEKTQTGSQEFLIVSFTNTQQAEDAAVITIQKAGLQVDQSFAQYIQGERQKIQTDTKITSEVKGVLAGGEAYQFDFAGKKDPPDVSGRVIYVLRDKEVFVLGATTTATKWDQYSPIIEKSLGSFRFISQR